MASTITQNSTIIVEVRSEVLGDSEFWRGPAKDVEEIRNIVARGLAMRVAKDGQKRSAGMWTVLIDEPQERTGD